MTIYPVKGMIQLEVQENSAGMLDVSSKETAVEYAKVIACGDIGTMASYITSGCHVFVKAWAIDIINHDGVKYYFVNVDTNGILAVVK